MRLPQPAPGRGEEKPVLASGQRRGQPFDAGGQRVGLIGAGRTADPRAGEKAFAESQRGQSLSGELERLFQKSFSVAKRVRTETDIGASAVSVAFAACTLARQIFESLADLNVLLVGAGETIELVARHLREHKVRHMIIANRTRERAQLLADEVGAEVITLPEIDERLADADIIISSTASPLPIIGKGMVERALKARRNQPMLLVDIAVPRDIEPEVGKLANAYLYSVDDLHAIIQSNLAQRKAAAVQAESIVQQESTNFMAWLRSQGAVETIRDYRSQADQIRAEMEAKALASIAQGANVEQVIHELAHKLTNRLIHAPTKSSSRPPATATWSGCSYYATALGWISISFLY